MEARGEFTIEGCIKMAWIMGLWASSSILTSQQLSPLHVGWVDAKSSEPVDDKDVKVKYEASILAHLGIRLISKVTLTPFIEHAISLLTT